MLSYGHRSGVFGLCKDTQIGSVPDDARPGKRFCRGNKVFVWVNDLQQEEGMKSFLWYVKVLLGEKYLPSEESIGVGRSIYTFEDKCMREILKFSDFFEFAAENDMLWRCHEEPKTASRGATYESRETKTRDGHLKLTFELL